MTSKQTSLEKGLALLEMVNSRVSVPLADLHERTGLPKPTIIRLLSALETKGYITKVSRKLGYRVGSRALALSSGFHGAPKLVEMSSSLLNALTTEILWPASLATLDLDAMVIRYSTIPLSPLSHKHSTLNNRLSLGRRAHGRAYLTFCSPREARALAQLISREEAVYIDRHRARFRRQGWADRDPTLEPDTDAIAAPILNTDRNAIATICVTYFRSAVNAAEKQRLAELVVETARQISAAHNADQNALPDIGEKLAAEPDLLRQ